MPFVSKNVIKRQAAKARRRARQVATALADVTRQLPRRSLARGMLSSHRHRFIRTCSTGATATQVLGLDEYSGFTWNGVATNGFNMQLAFKLSGMEIFFGGVSTATIPLPNYTELTALYDQYRIDWIELKFIFSNNTSSVNSPSTVLPTFYCVKDYDDTNTAGRADLEQYENCQIWQAGSQQMSDGMYIVRVRPNVDIALYQGVTTGYARGKPMFIDTGSPNVPHYGIKVAWDTFKSPQGSTIIGYMNLAATYHLTMMHTK